MSAARPPAKAKTALLGSTGVQSAFCDWMPPTTIVTMQNVGTRMFDVPPEELSLKKLLASLQDGSSSSSPR